MAATPTGSATNIQGEINYSTENKERMDYPAVSVGVTADRQRSSSSTGACVCSISHLSHRRRSSKIGSWLES